MAAPVDEVVAEPPLADDEVACLYSTADRNKPDRPTPDGDRRPLADSFVGGIVRAQEAGTASVALGPNVDELQPIRGHQIAFETGHGVRRLAMPILGSEELPVGVVVESGTTGRLNGRRVGEDAPGLMVSAIETIESAYDETVGE